jgi:hypothetical protein
MLFNNKGIEDVNTDELSLEAMSMIIEATIQDTMNPEEIMAFVENSEEVKEAIRLGIVTEKTIVRLDKYAKLSRAQKIAVFNVAKEKKDPLFRRLLTVWRLERFLEAKLMRKYGNEGLRRAKKAVTAQKTHPATVKKAITRAKNQLNAATSAKVIRRSKDTKAAAMANKLNMF